jgi:hypothetical protein
MEALSWTSLGLVIVAVALMGWGIARDRNKVFLASLLTLAAGMALGAVYDLHRGAYGWMTLDLVLVVVNVANFFWNRSIQRRKAVQS